ncbi:ParB N-terminal domain-containing protein [Ruthenibacterium lactatiformans]|jgi:ParB family chromosome partitioning protein|uniref:ParB N-terminal domain-containing protein n=1 Tax=Ruthenibacterium lactatiformans TaxID=1550024 RepID=UPI0022E1E473|nr:ParB N-terminal domain-containing protein [Ruthenibacterium lactatiformans]
MAKFDMAQFLNAQSAPAAGAPFTVKKIPLCEIEPSPMNFYGMREIEKLAREIELVGLLENLVVTPKQENGKYRLIAGERRYRALTLLADEGKDAFALAPCKVEEETSEAVEELKLIYANSKRELTDAEKMQEAIRLETRLKELKADGVKVPGRVREIAADLLKVSPAQVGIYETIDKKLTPELKAEFVAGKVGITAAHGLAKRPHEEQRAAAERLKAGVVPPKKTSKKKKQLQEPASSVVSRPEPSEKDDLISRKALMQRLHDAGGCGAPPESWADGYDKAINLAYGMVENAPTVDAAPVVHGEWKEWWPSSCALIMTGEEMLYRCTRCDAKYADTSNFCPNCGAKMDGGNDND